MRPSAAPQPLLIAIVGCDGSGKSTVTSHISAWLAEQRPTVVCHLGKQSGNVGRSLAGIPWIGPRLSRALFAKAKSARSGRGPGSATALVMYLFTLRQARRFRRMLALRQNGATILTDRFPQLELSGAIDGPALKAARPNGIPGWLARRERKVFAAMVAHRPDLVVRLQVSPEVAAARKPDHNAASLARKIEELAQLTYQGADIVEIDADQPLETVEAAVRSAITALIDRRAAPLPAEHRIPA